MTDLFQQQGQSDPQIDENKNYLEELVGPGKKFATPEDLAKGKWYADELIKIKNQREDELRAEYTRVIEENKTKASFEDLVKQLASNKEPIVKEDKEAFDPVKMEELVDRRIQQTESLKKQQENANLVRNTLKEKLGTNYQSILKQRTEDLGLSETFVNDLAKNHPTVLFKTLGLDQQQSQDNLFSAPPRSSQRNDTFAPSGSKERTWSYYQELKKANPKMYFDKQTAIQMQKDIIRLGERFQDGDYWKPGLHEQIN